MSADTRTTYGIIAGSDICTVNYTGAAGTGPVQLVASSRLSTAPGSCTVQATVSISGYAPLTAANSTQVITMTALELYLKDGDYQPPDGLVWYASQHVAAVPGVTRRVFRCSFSGFEQLSVWPLGRLSNCSANSGTNCTLVDLPPPAYTALETNDPSVAQLVINPRMPSRRNVLVPLKVRWPDCCGTLHTQLSAAHILAHGTYMQLPPSPSCRSTILITSPNGCVALRRRAAPCSWPALAHS